MSGVDPAAGEQPRLLVEVWSDVVCPWCYVAKRHLEEAVAAFEHPGEVHVVHRSFELDSWAAGAHGSAEQRAVAAAEPGLGFDFARVVPANTFDAHRMCHLGAGQGGPALQAAVLERLFSAHFAEGRAIDDTTTLQRLGAEAGLDERRLAAVLAADDYADAVRADEQRAVGLGVQGVPFTLVNEQLTEVGGGPVEGFVRLLQQAWSTLGIEPP